MLSSRVHQIAVFEPARRTERVERRVVPGVGERAVAHPGAGAPASASIRRLVSPWVNALFIPMGSNADRTRRTRSLRTSSSSPSWDATARSLAIAVAAVHESLIGMLVPASRWASRRAARAWAAPSSAGDGSSDAAEEQTSSGSRTVTRARTALGRGVDIGTVADGRRVAPPRCPDHRYPLARSAAADPVPCLSG